MGKLPTVSVVIPAHNPGSYLRDALDSVVAQTFTDWECIVVDDGSDEDLDWVAEFHPKVALIRQAKGGVSAARNAGAAAGAGGLIAFLDADDTWLPEKLARQREVMAGDVALSATAFYRFGDGGVREGWAPDASSFQELLRGDCICTSTTMVERGAFDSVGGFDEALPAAEDWDLWLRLARSRPFVGMDEVLAGYRVHGGQTSNRIRQMWWWSVRVLLKLRGPLVPSLAGARRMGVLYGGQMFDQFRETRQPRSLFWSFVMWPDYVLGEAVRQAKTLVFGRFPSR